MSDRLSRTGTSLTAARPRRGGRRHRHVSAISAREILAAAYLSRVRDAPADKGVATGRESEPERRSPYSDISA